MRYKRPDIKNASSIIKSAEKDMKFTLSMEPTEESGPTIVKNIYECFRMLGDALLTVQGVETADHITQINELVRLKIETKRPINLLDNLRRLRHNINYYGYRPSSIEVEDVILIAKSLFDPLLKEVTRIINELR